MLYCNVSVANIYREPTFHSEVDTQAVLWEALVEMDRRNDFIRVRCEDGYEGWINRHQVACHDEPRENLLPVTLINGVIWRDTRHTDPLSDVAAGGYLLVLESGTTGLRVELPDGRIGWVDAGACAPQGAFDRSNLKKIVRKHMGLPYRWGGKSGKGVDCSGLVQLSHKLLGVSLRRDAWMQFEDARPVSNEFQGGKTGDLLFFAESGSRITHVAIRLEESYFIHARGMVRINSSHAADALFDQELSDTFVEVRSFF